jgi:hypothetical protein
MGAVLKFLGGLLEFVNRITDAFMRKKDRDAGHNEAAIAVKVNSDAVLDQADLARRERIAADTVGGQLREQDGHRRD